MSPVVKYTLARLGLFVACAVVAVFALPRDLNPLLKLLIALVVSAAGSFFLLRGMRDEVASHLSTSSDRRAQEKERLRAALSGEDEVTK
jgi:hypothetical protein